MDYRPYVTIHITRGTLLIVLAFATNLLTFAVTKKVYYKKGIDAAVEYITDNLKGSEKAKLDGSTISL